MAISASDYRESDVYDLLVISCFFKRAVAVYDVAVLDRA